MSKSIRKILMFVLILVAITTLCVTVKAATIKETTNANDEFDTIENGTIVIGVTKFTPDQKVITATKAAIAGANDRQVYSLKNADDTNYSYAKVYYYLDNEWFELDAENKATFLKDGIASLDIYYVNNKLKEGISLPTKPVEKSEYTVFFVDGEKEVSKKVVVEGQKVGELPTLTAKPHFTYTWADKAGNAVTENTIITADTVVFAKWGEAEKATMTLKVAGKEDIVITKYVGETITVDTPVKDGSDSVTYTFNGWYTENGDPYVINTMPKGGKVLTAGWDAKVTKSENVNLKEVIAQISNEDTMSNVTVSNNLKVEESLTIPENMNLVISEGIALRLAKNANIENIDRVTKQEGAIIQKEADDKDSIIAGLALDYADEVVLANDVTLDSALQVNAGVLNLDTKAIKVEGLSTGILTTGEVVLKNGTVECTEEMGLSKQHIAILNKGNLTADNVTVKQYYGIYNYDGATMNIKNSNITAYHAGVVGLTDSNTTIENTTITSKWYGVAGNGTQTNAIMIIKDSTITSNEEAAIYFPSTEKLEVNNSTITGLVGIEARAGKINVTNNSKITSTGSSAVYTDDEIKAQYDKKTNGTFVSSDKKSSGSAIFFAIQKPYGAGTEAAITVDNTSTLEGEYGVRVYQATTASETESVKSLTINSNGTFTGDVSKALHTYNAGNTSLGITAKQEVKDEASLKEAINNEVVKEIVLTGDIEISEILTISTGANVVFDTNNHNVTSTKAAPIFVVSDGTLEIKGDGKIEATTEIAQVFEGGEIKITGNGNYISKSNVVLYSGSVKAGQEAKGGKITIEGGNFKGQEGCVITTNGGELNITDGEFTAIDNAIIAGNGTKASTDEIAETTINITGGTFNGGITSGGYIAMGIYHPQKGTLNVTGGTFNITKGSGIIMRSGTLNLTGATFKYTNEDEEFKGWAGDKKSQIPVGKDVVKCTHEQPAGYAYNVVLQDVDENTYSVLEFAE